MVSLVTIVLLGTVSCTYWKTHFIILFGIRSMFLFTRKVAHSVCMSHKPYLSQNGQSPVLVMVSSKACLAGFLLSLRLTIF